MCFNKNEGIYETVKSKGTELVMKLVKRNKEWKLR